MTNPKTQLMNIKKLPALAAVLFVVITAGAAYYFQSTNRLSPLFSSAANCDFYVATNGTPSGDGSVNSPWNLKTALANPASVQGGDTICVRQGTYTGRFVNKLVGSAGFPITVKAYPGERVTIDGYSTTTLTAPTPSIAGYEFGNITVADPSIFTLDQAAIAYIDDFGGEMVQVGRLVGGNTIEVVRGWGGTCGSNPCTAWPAGTVVRLAGPILRSQGSYTNFIGFEFTISNQFTRVVGQPGGVDDAMGIVDECNGCKYINNVIHDTAGGIGSHATGKNTEFYGNIAYNVGVTDVNLDPSGHGLYVQNTNGNPVKLIKHNISFHNANFGYQSYGDNGGLDNITYDGNVAFDNGIFGHNQSYQLLVGRDPSFANNIIDNSEVYSSYGSGSLTPCYAGSASTNGKLRNNYVVGSGTQGWSCPGLVEVTGNTAIGGANVGFPLVTGNTMIPNIPTTGVRAVVHPNQYETGRAHVIVYNWAQTDSVSVNISSAGLTSGQTYEIRDVQNYFGSPIATGTYNGSDINIPMTSTTVPQLIGTSLRQPFHTSKQFGAFVIVPTSTGGTPAPAPTISSFTASPTTITSGYSTFLSWDVTNADTISIDNGIGTVTGSLITASPTVTTTYTLTATNSNGSVTRTATVTVNPAPPTSGSLQLQFSSYLGGGAEDTIRDLETDSQGNIYVTGGTSSSNFITTAGAYDRTFATGGTSLGSAGPHDVFVAKFSPSGQLIWSTFLGGPNYDRAYALELDSSNNVVVAGRAGNGFPTTSGAVQPNFAGDSNPLGAYGNQDGFVAKISADGSQLLWSTYYGEGGGGFIRDFDLDSSNNVYLAMAYVTQNLSHITAGAFDTTQNGGEDSVIAKISSTGSSTSWASYLGGSGYDGGAPAIRVDGSNNAYVVIQTTSSNIPTTAGAFDTTQNGDHDFYVAKFNSTGSSLSYATYLGGTGGEYLETHSIFVDGSGNAYINGSTLSSNYPTTSGAYDTTFNGTVDIPVSKLSANGTQLLASTFVGGSGDDNSQGIVVASDGIVTIAGDSASTNFPISSDAHQSTKSGGSDAVVVQLDNSLSSLVYSTFLGGSGVDHGRVANISSGAVYMGGATNSTNFPTLNAHQGTFGGGSGYDGMFAKFTVGTTPTPTFPVINSFTASPASITSGQSSTLSWSVTGATTLSLNQGIGTVTGTSRSVSPTIPTTYTLTATNSSGSVTSTATVNVTAPGDTTHPTVSITSPAAGATVSGTAVALSATASDNVGVVGVQFKVDGVNLGAEDTTAPYGATWNSTLASNGTHAVTATARDAAGNFTTSSAVSVTVSNVVVPSTVATPTISPNGGTFTTAQSVTLATATSGATIRYTIDGSSPTSTTGMVYSGPFSVTATSTVKAIAYKSGLTDSSVASAAFTITAPPTNGPAPKIIAFSVSSKTQTTATLTWKTDISATGSINYGRTKSSLSLSVTETDPESCTATACTHTATLTGLTRNTTYYYQITATNNNASTTTIRSSFRTSR